MPGEQNWAAREAAHQAAEEHKRAETKANVEKMTPPARVMWEHLNNALNSELQSVYDAEETDPENPQVSVEQNLKLMAKVRDEFPRVLEDQALNTEIEKERAELRDIEKSHHEETKGAKKGEKDKIASHWLGKYRLVREALDDYLNVVAAKAQAEIKRQTEKPSRVVEESMDIVGQEEIDDVPAVGISHGSGWEDESR